MDLFRIAKTAEGLTNDEIAAQLEKSLEGRTLRRVLIVPPDFTRFHSNAGFITQVYHKLLTAQGAQVDVMPALGTHVPVSETQWKAMFKDVPFEKMIVHNWRTDVVVTDRRLYYRRGIIDVKDHVTDLGSITDVTIDPSIAGRIFGYANVRIQTKAGDDDFVLKEIKNAYQMRSVINQGRDALEQASPQPPVQDRRRRERKR